MNDPYKKRSNAGFEIIDSISIAETEYVLGVNSASPTMYVTWKCSDGDYYYWGHYISDMIAAKKDLLNRAMEELKDIEQRLSKTQRDKDHISNRDDAR